MSPARVGAFTYAPATPCTLCSFCGALSTLQTTLKPPIRVCVFVCLNVGIFDFIHIVFNAYLNPAMRTSLMYTPVVPVTEPRLIVPHFSLY